MAEITPTDEGGTGDDSWTDEVDTSIVGLLTGGVGDLAAFVRNTVFNLLDNKLLRPLYNTLLKIGVMLVTLVGVIFLGSDLQLGYSENIPAIDAPGAELILPDDGAGYMGLADVPVWLVTQTISAFEPVGEAALAPIQTLNTAIAEAATQAGIAGPPIVFGLQMLELAVGLYALSLAVQTVVGYVVPGLSGRIAAVVRRPLQMFR